MIETMRREFRENHQMQVPINENQLGTIVLMSQIAEKVGMDYSEVADSKHVTQPVNDFLFPWEE